MSASENTGQIPTLAEVLDHATDTRLSRVNTCLPGKIVTYDAARQEASVQPLIKVEYFDEQDLRQIEALPVIQHVPVVFPGSGGWRLKWPITKGDTVLLLFASRSIDQWLARGGLVDPDDDRRHDINDCIAIPGLQAFPETGENSSPATIEFTANNEIHAGGSDPLVRRSEFLAHGHPVIATGAVSPTAGPVNGVAPLGSSVTFPGTAVLKGG